MVRPDRHVHGEEASWMDDGIPSDRRARREECDSEPPYCARRVHIRRRQQVDESECQRDTGGDHEPEQPETPRSALWIPRLGAS